MPPAEAGEDLVRSTLAAVSDRIERKRRNWMVYRRTVGAVTAAAILIIGSMHVYYQQLRPTPYDLRILGQAEWLAGSATSLRVGVFDQRTGKPLEDIAGTLQLRNRQTNDVVQLVSFRTGDNGEQTPRFELPDWDDGDYELLFSAMPAGSEETLLRTVRLKRSWKLMLSTDKPVYQPGQVIHIRSLALRQPDLQPMVGEDVVISVADAKGNRIFKSQSQTSRFGIAHADCRLAPRLNEGDYTVHCEMAGSTSQRTGALPSCA